MTEPDAIHGYCDAEYGPCQYSPKSACEASGAAESTALTVAELFASHSYNAKHAMD